MKTNRSGPSERLQAALDEIGYPAIREGRAQHFADDFEVSLSSAHRMLSGDHVPSRMGLKSRIAKRLNISAAYWEYGIDDYAEGLVCSQRDMAWSGLLRRLRELGYDIAAVPIGLLEQLVRLVYRSALDSEGVLDQDELNRIVEMSSFMIENAKPDDAGSPDQTA
jgi:hypothetical protein